MSIVMELTINVIVPIVYFDEIIHGCFPRWRQHAAALHFGFRIRLKPFRNDIRKYLISRSRLLILHLQIPRHQFGDGLAGVLTFKQDCVGRFGDGHGHAFAVG